MLHLVGWIIWIIWYRTLHVSDRFTVHHQECNTVHTTIGICHTGYADCLLASSQHTVLHSWWWTVNLSETCRVLYQMIQIIQPTRCNTFTSLLLDLYVWLNMFRASHRPSSCWATHKRQVINMWKCCILLVELFKSFGIELYMFRTGLLSIIRSVTMYTQQ